MNVLKALSHPVLNLFLTTVQSGRRGLEPPLYRWGNQEVVHSFYVAELGFEPRILTFALSLTMIPTVLTTLQITSCLRPPNHIQAALFSGAELQTLNAFSPSHGLHC